MRKIKHKQTPCKYFPCYVAKETGRDCSNSSTCRTAAFFNKFGEEDYLSAVFAKANSPVPNEYEDEYLGIGAMSSEGLKRLLIKD